MRARWWRPALVVLLVVALGVGAGLVVFSFLRPSSTSSGPVSAAGSRVPAGFSATATSRTDPLAAAFAAATGGWDLQPAGPLAAPLTVTLPLNAPDTTGEQVVVVGRTGPGTPAQYFPATVTPDRGHVSFTTTHFSLYQALFVRPLPGLGDQLREAVNTVTGEFDATAAAPQCGAQPTGYRVASTRSDAVYWCLGSDGGRPVLKIVDNRRYALEAHHGALPVLNPGVDDHLDPTTAEIAPRSELRLDLTLAAGQAARINLEYGGYADAKYQLLLGVTTAATFLGLGPATDTAKIVEKLAMAGCIKDVADDKFQNFTDIVASCMSPRQLADSFGTAGAFLAPIITTGALVNYFRSRADLAADLGNHRDRYAIVVLHAPDPTAPAPGGGGSTTATPDPAATATCADAVTLGQAYRSRLDPGQTIAQVTGIRCVQGWAIAEVDVAEADDAGTNAYTGVFQKSGSTWVARDPATACSSGQIPASLNQLACNSN